MTLTAAADFAFRFTLQGLTEKRDEQRRRDLKTADDRRGPAPVPCNAADGQRASGIGCVRGVCGPIRDG